MKKQLQSKVISAAVEVGRHEIALTAIRRAKRRCEVRESPANDNQWLGSPPCDMNLTDEEICQPCLDRRAALEPYRYHIRERRLARAKLVRWVTKLIALEARP